VIVYLLLGAVDLVLMLRYARKGIDEEDSGETGAAAVPAMSY